MKKIRKLVIGATVVIALASGQAGAAEKQVTLMLGGKSCESHPKEIMEALTGIKGVSGVDLKSMKGHALVKQDGTVKPESLVEAIKSVKDTKTGMDWYCTAEPMD